MNNQTINKLINSLILDINDKKFKSLKIFNMYNNKGFLNFFSAYVEYVKEKGTNNNVSDNIKKILDNELLYEYEKKEFIPLALINEYQIITNKSKLDSVIDLYDKNGDTFYDEKIKNSSNYKILSSIVNSNYCYLDYHNIIDELLLIANDMINNVVIKNVYNEQDVEYFSERLNEIVFNDDFCEYFSVIKKTLFNILEDNVIDNNEIQYLIVMMAFLEQFKNTEFYFLNSEFIDNETLSILSYEFDVDYPYLMQIKHNYYYNGTKSIINIIENLVNDLIKEITVNLDNTEIFSNYKNTQFSLLNCKDNILALLNKIYNFSKIYKCTNYDNYYEYYYKFYKNNNYISLFDLTSSLNIIPSIFKNEIFILKDFEKNNDNYIFEYNLDNNQKLRYEGTELMYKNKKTLDENEIIFFSDSLNKEDGEEYNIELIDGFSNECTEEINNMAFDLNNSVDDFNIEKYDLLKKLYHKLKGDCLVVGLANLSEPYYLLEKVFSEKIEKKSILTMEQKKLIDLINTNFINMIDRLKEDINTEIETPIFEIYSRFVNIFKSNIMLSNLFLTNNGDKYNEIIDNIIKENNPTTISDDKLNTLENETTELNNEIHEDENNIINDDEEEREDKLLKSNDSEIDMEYFMENDEDTFSEDNDKEEIIDYNIDDEYDNIDIDTLEDNNEDAIPKELRAFDSHNDFSTQYDKSEQNIDSKEEEINENIIQETLNTEETIEINENIDKPIEEEIVNTEKNNTNEGSVNTKSIINDNNSNIDQADEVINTENSIDDNNNTDEVVNTETIIEDNNSIDKPIITENTMDNSNNNIKDNLTIENQTNNNDIIEEEVLLTNENSIKKVVEKIVYIKEDPQVLNSNKTITYDNENNMFIINNTRALSNQEWGTLVSNTRHNLEEIWAYNTNYSNNLEARQDDELISPNFISNIDNLITEFKNVNLLKTATLLLKLKYFILFLIDNDITYNHDVNSIITNVVSITNSLIIEREEFTNNEDNELILELISSIKEDYEFKILKEIIRSSLASEIRESTKNISTNISNLGQSVQKISEYSSNISKSIDKFSLAHSSNMVNLSNSITELSSLFESKFVLFSDNIKENMSTLNVNMKVIYKKLKSLIGDDDDDNGDQTKKKKRFGLF